MVGKEEHSQHEFYLTQLGFLAQLTANLGYDRRKYVYYRAPIKENGQLILKRPEVPNGFQERGFKDPFRTLVREEAAGCMISSCPVLTG